MEIWGWFVLGIWYESLLEQDHIQYKLVLSESFEPTENLKLVIPSFFELSKGLHVAIICTDEELSDDELYKLFDIKYKKVTILHNNENCGNYKNINHYMCCTKAGNILDALHKVVDFMEALKRDEKEVVGALDFYGDSFNESKSWTQNLAERLTQTVLSPEDIDDGCADMRMIIYLPLRFFSVFETENCYFPSFIEYVLKALTTDQHYQEIIVENKRLKKRIIELISENEKENDFSFTTNYIQEYGFKFGRTLDFRKAGHIAVEIIFDFKEENNLDKQYDLSRSQEFKEYLEKRVNEIFKLQLVSDTEKNSNYQSDSAIFNLIPSNTRNKQSGDEKVER